MKKEKEITINKLTRVVEAGFKTTNANIEGVAKIAEKDNKNLAIMVANGFSDTQKQLNGLKGEVKNLGIKLGIKFDLHDGELKLMRSEMDKGFRELQREVEDIKLRLDRIDKVTNEDIAALGDEIYQIKSRTKKLEQKYTKLKLTHN